MSLKRNKRQISNLNQIVYRFVQSSNATKTPINGTVIKSFALEAAEQMNLKEFKASNGWINRFTKKFRISLKSTSGEAGYVSQTTVEEWLPKLKELIQSYDRKDVLNFDETGLFWKLLPKKSYVIKGSKHIGGKKSKKRITIALGCSFTSEKLKPLIIGNPLNPRCFKDLKYDINSLGVHYFSNKTAWMTKIIFNKWLKKSIRNLEMKRGMYCFLWITSHLMKYF